MHFTEDIIDFAAHKIIAAVPSELDLLSQLDHHKISSAHVECQHPWFGTHKTCAFTSGSYTLDSEREPD